MSGHENTTGNSPDKSSLSFIRHELKTPINAVIGYSEMLIEEIDEEGQSSEHPRDDLERIHAAGLELLSLVNELKIEADLENSGFRDRLGELIDVVEDSAKSILIKGLVDVLEDSTEEILDPSADKAGETFAGDIVKIRNAGRQLLALAEEFMGTGSLQKDAENSGQSTDPPSPQTIHEIATAVTASSPSLKVEGEMPPTILVVDDNEMNRDLLSRQLAKLDYAFEIAANGREAIEMMHAGQFDLVLMDVIMPEMDGIQALKEIKEDPGLRHIPVIMVSSLDDMGKIVKCIEIGAEDYLPKPPDPVLLRARLGACLEKKRLIDREIESQKRLEELNKSLDVRNRLIRETFGRYLSDEIVENILETPSGLKLGGEKRRITIMMSDLRGFTSIAERLSPEDVVAVINNYLEVMTGVIMKYNGTIDEFIGDAILALFGAPVKREDDAVRAVACAVEMQTAMEAVNKRNREAGYPEVSMGIGINTGNVVVGNIGCSKRTKYGVVGKNVNLTSRIESYTVGGQILISGTTLEACHGELCIDRQMEIMPKGVREPITIYEVAGVGDSFNVWLPAQEEAELVRLRQPLPVRFAVIEGKHAGGSLYEGELFRANMMQAEVRSELLPEIFSNLRICLYNGSDVTLTELLAKVTENDSADPGIFRVHYTYVPPEVESMLRGICSGEGGMTL